MTRLSLLRLGGAVALVAVLAACAASSTTRTDRRDPDRIQADEIAELGVNNAYLIVSRLRPAWLRQRIDTRTNTQRELQTLVMLNGSRYGYLPTLRDIPAETIGRMEFLQGSAAQAFLAGAGDRDIGAIIQVFTRGAARNP